MGNIIGDRAVVLGGSITALFAASALTKHYRDVVLVDRDTLHEVRHWRRGAPQTRHINGLLARGHQALEEMYPGITQEMTDDGIPLSDLAGTVRWYFNGKRLKQKKAGLTCVAATRPVMEYYVRRRAEQLPNVRFLERTDIVGLITNGDDSRVTGVRVHHQGDGYFDDEVIDADLVVDATGRGSRSPLWLEQLGCGRVESEGTKVGLAYASRHYKLTYDPFGSDHSINPVANPTLPRGAIFTKTDSGNVELTTYGILGDHPPTDPEGFNDFVKTLAAPEIHEAIVQAEPLDDVGLFKFPTTLWRHFEALDKLPAGYLIIGDAVCTPNPVYAQAQTLASLEALALHRHLADGEPDPRAFQQDVADIIAPAWAMTTSVDLSFPGVPGERTPEILASHAFMRQVQEAMTKDAEITAAFFRVAGLVDQPSALMDPAFIEKVQKIVGSDDAEPAAA